MAATQDDNGWTHIDWELEAVTPRMIDWFWSNIERGYLLWHPSQHGPLIWWRSPAERFVGALPRTTQKWADGKPFSPHLPFDDPAELREDVMEPQQRGLVWAEHAAEEVGNWAAFLPDLYRLYSVVRGRPSVNPFHSLKLWKESRADLTPFPAYR